MIYYMPTLLVNNVGQTTHNAQIISGFIELSVVLGCLIPALRLDQMGRRKTMLVGSFCLGICMMFISILLSIHKKSASIGAVAFFILWIFTFGATLNVVPWVYGPEVLPLEARARGTAISVSTHWLWNFFIVMVTPVLINRLDWKTYLIFMCTNVSSDHTLWGVGQLANRAEKLAFVPIIYFFYPETGNCSLEEIDGLFITPVSYTHLTLPTKA